MKASLLTISLTLLTAASLAGAVLADRGHVVVVKGDTLNRIAKLHGCTVQELAALNLLTNDTIRIGQKLKLPASSSPHGISVAAATITSSGVIPRQINISSSAISSGAIIPPNVTIMPSAGGYVLPQETPVVVSPMTLEMPALETMPVKITVPGRKTPAVLYPDVLAKAAAKNVSFIIALDRQRGYLLVNGEVAIDTPVCTGMPGYATPTGQFKITERIETGKVSNRYFVEMPFWMRLGTRPIGMHVGAVRAKPSSHGCIRLPAALAPKIFASTSSGTLVQVLATWTPPQSKATLPTVELAMAR